MRNHVLLLANQGCLESELGRLAAAERTLREARALGRAHGAHQARAVASSGLAMVALALGRRDEASALFDEVDAAFALEPGDGDGPAASLGNRGVWHLDAGEWDRAVPLLEGALSEMGGSRDGSARFRCFLAVATARQEPRAAARTLIDLGAHPEAATPTDRLACLCAAACASDASEARSWLRVGSKGPLGPDHLIALRWAQGRLEERQAQS